MKISRSEIEEIMRLHDIDKTGKISFDEFKVIFSVTLEEQSKVTTEEFSEKPDIQAEVWHLLDGIYADVLESGRFENAAAKDQLILEEQDEVFDLDLKYTGRGEEFKVLLSGIYSDALNSERF